MYDKGYELKINKTVGDKFSDKDLKTATKVLMANSLVAEGLDIENVVFHGIVLTDEEGYTVQMRATGGK